MAHRRALVARQSANEAIRSTSSQKCRPKWGRPCVCLPMSFCSLFLIGRGTGPCGKNVPFRPRSGATGSGLLTFRRWRPRCSRTDWGRPLLHRSAWTRVRTESKLRRTKLKTQGGETEMTAIVVWYNNAAARSAELLGIERQGATTSHRAVQSGRSNPRTSSRSRRRSPPPRVRVGSRMVPSGSTATGRGARAGLRSSGAARRDSRSGVTTGKWTLATLLGQSRWWPAASRPGWSMIAFADWALRLKPAEGGIG